MRRQRVWWPEAASRGLAAGLVAGAVLAAAAAVPAAAGPPVTVSIQFDAFSPSQVDLLPGEVVEWTNVSERHHTVTAADSTFDSGELVTDDRFSHAFDATGPLAYFCRIHLGMTGSIDVRRVILDVVPQVAVPAGQRVRLSGRSAESAPVTVERDTGTGFRPVATAAPAADGTWAAEVTAVSTADYRATLGPDASETRRLLVTDRRVHVTATRAGVRATVTPPDPNAHVVLQLYLPERFGWWPVRRVRLDYVSRADFSVRRRARARVVLVDRDGWTALATSPVIRAGRRSTRH